MHNKTYQYTITNNIIIYAFCFHRKTRYDNLFMMYWLKAITAVAGLSLPRGQDKNISSIFPHFSCSFSHFSSNFLYFLPHFILLESIIHHECTIFHKSCFFSSADECYAFKHIKVLITRHP